MGVWLSLSAFRRWRKNKQDTDVFVIVEIIKMQTVATYAEEPQHHADV